MAAGSRRSHQRLTTPIAAIGDLEESRLAAIKRHWSQEVPVTKAVIRCELSNSIRGPNAQQTFASGKALLWQYRQVVARLALCATKLSLSRLRDSRLSGSTDPHPQAEFKAAGRFSFPEYTRRFQCCYAVQKRP